MTRNLPHVIPGLTGNLSLQHSAAKVPFYAFYRGRCHFTNPCLPHPRPPEADFVPDHFGRARRHGQCSIATLFHSPRPKNTSSYLAPGCPLYPFTILQKVVIASLYSQFCNLCKYNKKTCGLEAAGDRFHILITYQLYKNVKVYSFHLAMQQGRLSQRSSPRLQAPPRDFARNYRPTQVVVETHRSIGIT